MTSHNLLFERGINKNYLKYSPKTGWLSLIFIIIICIFLILYISFYSVFLMTLWGRYYDYLRFNDEEDETKHLVK